MKKSIGIIVIAVLIISLNVIFADNGLTEEEQYGMALEFIENEDYPGDITIDGLYVYQDQDDYVFTLLYSNGELYKQKDGDELKVKTSFFNPPDGDLIGLNWLRNFDRVSSTDSKVQYRVEASKFEELSKRFYGDREISIFLYDVIYNENNKNIGVYFKTQQLDASKMPTVNEMRVGYELNSESLTAVLDNTPSKWARKSIEELYFENLLRADAFDQYILGITRQRFVYLMVELYEQITSKTVEVDPAIVFEDSNDEYVLKAASLGITSGIGDGLFGPDLIVNREQMVAFIIKTLNLAGVHLDKANTDEMFDDDADISNWAKSSVYMAKVNGIVSGIGRNSFAAKKASTNEQALYLTYDLLKRFCHIKWYEEVSSEDFYIRFEDELYQVNLDENVILDNVEAPTSIMFESFGDIETFVNLALLEKHKLNYTTSEKAGIKGTLNVYDYNQVIMDVTNNLRGGNKIAEETDISIADGAFKAYTIYLKKDTPNHYDGFYSVKYYDMADQRQKLMTLSTDEIATALDKSYTLEYNQETGRIILEIK